MFVEERQALILEELRQNGKVRVKELSDRFSVTEDLIRKDLTALEQKGKLKKIYGGAVVIKENVQRKVASQRKNLNTAQKRVIAQKALSLIQDGSVIFLDISTTSIELASLLSKSNFLITVVTNMLDVVNILASSSVNVIFVGGEFDYGRDGFVGSLAMEMLQRFRFDLAFMGVVGVDLDDNSVMTYMANDGETKQVVLKNAKNAYMLCEVEKLNQLGNYQYAQVTDFTGIIMDQDISKEVKKKIKKYNVTVVE